MAKLTKRVIDGLRANPARDVYEWDTELRGFGVRVLPTQVASFVIKYRNQERRTRKLVIGRVGTLTPDEARSMAREKLAAVAKGEDPAEERRQARQAITMRELCGRYLEAADKGSILGKKGVAKKPSTLVTDRSRIARHILPLLGHRQVVELSQADVTRFMRDVAGGSTAAVHKTDKLRGKSIVQGGRGAAARTMGLLGGIFSFAISEGVITSNPVHGVRRPADQRRQIRLTPETYRALGYALWKMVENRGNASAMTAVWLLALTGCRRGEIERLRWAEVDDAGHALRLSDSKEGASVRPIGHRALALLARAERNPSSVYVCPGRDPGRPGGGLSRVWRRLAVDAHLHGISLHGLRHSYASTAADLGYGDSTVAALLGHSAGTVTSRYMHHLDAVLIAAADKVAASIWQSLTSSRDCVEAARIDGPN